MSDTSVSLDELFDKLHLRPLRQIDQNDDAWVAAGYLVTSLNSFSDGLAVMDGKDPIGTIGGKIFLTQLKNNPSHSFFKQKKSKEIMMTGLQVLQTKTLLSEVLKIWKNSRFAFSAVQKDGQLYALSLRNLLLLISELNSSVKLSDLPKKPLVTFSNDDSIGDILNKMLKNNVRRLVLDGTSQLISDRTLLTDICIEMNYLKYTENVLNLSSTVLNTESPETITKDMTISELAHKLSNEIHPTVIYDENIITPLDLVTAAYGENK
jgi:CBS domain-containing protein